MVTLLHGQRWAVRAAMTKDAFVQTARVALTMIQHKGV